MLVEAGRLPGALEGKGIPGMNLFHRPRSPSNSHFFRSALCSFLIGDQKAVVRTECLKSCLTAESRGLGVV